MWDEASNYKNGFAIVQFNNKFGLITKTGDLIIPTELDKAPELSENIVLLQHNDKIAWYNLSERKFIWKEEGY